MADKELDPLRDRMIAALYGELPPEDEEEFLTLLAANPALKSEWDELRETRAFLGAADAADTAPAFAFALPAAAAPASLPDRLRSLWRGGLLRPAAGFALAAAACVLLLIAGLRVDRVAGGLAFRFGADTPERPALAANDARPAAAVPGPQPGAPELVLANAQQPEANAGGGTSLDLSAPVTRAEMATFAQELVNATEAQLREQEERNLGQTVFMMKDYHRALEQERQRDRREITTDMNRAILALLQAGVVGGERLELPRESVVGDSSSGTGLPRQTEEGESHE